MAPSGIRAQSGDGDHDVDPIINRIVFEGNNSISSGRLKGLMRTREPSFFAILRKPHLDPALLRRDIAHLEGFYHSIGYFEAIVRLDRLEYSEDSRYVDIHIRVVEGQPTVVASVEFTDGLLVREKDLRKGLRLEPGKPFNRSFLNTDVYTLKRRYFERGYLAVSIEDSVRIDGREVFIRYAIEPGTQIFIRDIGIKGTVAVKNKVVEREFTFEPGEVCRLDKLLETQRNLFETGLFTVVDIVPENLDPIERTVDIEVRVRERKPAYIEAGFGVGNVIGSRLSGEWGTRNLFGLGRTLRLRTEYAYDLFEGDKIDFARLQFVNTFYRYDATFQMRRLFGTKIVLGLEAFLERDATVVPLDLRTIGFAIGGRRNFGRHSELNSDFTIERIERGTTDSPDVDRSSTRVLAVGARRDKRDYVLEPRSGTLRTARAEVAGGILGGDNDFYGVGGALQAYHSLGKGAVFAWRVRSGYAAPYGQSTVVPVERRFFLGGSNSVRGYAENSLAGPGGENEPGGEFMLLTNIELRHRLPYISRWKITGALFVDGGNVWGSVDDVRFKDFRVVVDEDDITDEDYRYGVGYGLRYHTPIGPIRVDFGVPIKRRPDDEKYGVHLSLGHIF